MKTLLSDSRETAARILSDLTRWSKGVIASPLDARRTLCTRPLRNAERRTDCSKMHRLAREMEGLATVGYYGHPSRRTAIAYPLPGVSMEQVRKAACDAFVPVNNRVSCGNLLIALA